MKKTTLYRDSRYVSVPKLYFQDVGFMTMPVCPEFKTLFSYKIKAGDTLPSLAHTFYGNSSHQWAILVANDLGFPPQLPAGKTILIPSRDEVLFFVYRR